MSRSYEYDANVLVVLAIAAIAVLACVVLVSLGKGGELAEFPPDVQPLELPEAGRLAAVDFMALRLPVRLVGYHTGSVDETLRLAAHAVSMRDTRIAILEQRVSELLASRLQARQEVYARPGEGVRTRHEPAAPGQPLVLTDADAAAVDAETASASMPARGFESYGKHADDGSSPTSDPADRPSPEGTDLTRSSFEGTAHARSNVEGTGHARPDADETGHGRSNAWGVGSARPGSVNVNPAGSGSVSTPITSDSGSASTPVTRPAGSDPVGMDLPGPGSVGTGFPGPGSADMGFAGPGSASVSGGPGTYGRPGAEDPGAEGKTTAEGLISERTSAIEGLTSEGTPAPAEPGSEGTPTAAEPDSEWPDAGGRSGGERR